MANRAWNGECDDDDDNDNLTDRLTEETKKKQEKNWMKLYGNENNGSNSANQRKYSFAQRRLSDHRFCCYFRPMSHPTVDTSTLNPTKFSNHHRRRRLNLSGHILNHSAVDRRNTKFHFPLHWTCHITKAHHSDWHFGKVAVSWGNIWKCSPKIKKREKNMRKNSIRQLLQSNGN